MQAGLSRLHHLGIFRELGGSGRARENCIPVLHLELLEVHIACNRYVQVLCSAMPVANAPLRMTKAATLSS